MGKATGIVIGTKTESELDARKHILEIQLDKQDRQLGKWLKKKVSVEMIE